MGRSGAGRRAQDEDGDREGAGGEVNLSIEETNKLRISLGLKPLAVDTAPKGPSKEELDRQEQEASAKTEELANRIKQTRERRIQQEKLAQTKTLGEADPDVDDVMAWVNKSRTLTKEQQTKKTQAQAARRKSQQQIKKKKQADSDDSDEDDGEDGADLAGMKVAHSVEELDAGESLILTLEDKGILDEKGNLIEEEEAALENIYARETKKRAKAFEDSRKGSKPDNEYDGKKRSLLDKYDEEEEEIITLGGAGTIKINRQQRQVDVGSRLAAGVALLDAAAASSVPSFAAASDYLTPEEVEAMKKPKKKKEGRKLKKKTLTGEELAALEADASARGGADLGSRAEREARQSQKAADEAAAAADKRSRFDHALAKANYASLALRPDANKDTMVGGNDEDDDDLYRSLNKARQLAQRSTAPAAPEDIAQQLIKRREANEANAANNNGGILLPTDFSTGMTMTFNDTEEFSRAIAAQQEERVHVAAVKQEEAGLNTLPTGPVSDAAAAGGSGGSDNGMYKNEEDYSVQAPPSVPMDEDIKQEDEEDEGNKAGTSRRGGRSGGGEGGEGGRWGSWAPADDKDGDEVMEEEEEKPKRRPRVTPTEPEIDASASITGEQQIGRGLGGVLSFLKERGELTQGETFAGRTNDSRDSYFTAAMGGFKDLYTGGRQEDKLALDVELALTKRDEFGRILTPKEAFRQMCYRFHGIYPSKNTKEKRAKQVEKERAQLKQASGASEGGTMGAVKEAQKKFATPYVVLSGNVKPGQSRDAAAGYATVNPSDHDTDPWELVAGRGGGAGDASVPRLGGGQTPLMGNAKVEAMLGVKRPAGGTSSMPPPPPKAPRH